jgi:hypothetical protein
MAEADVMFDSQSYFVSGRPKDYGPGRECTMGKGRCKTAEQCGDLGKVHRFVHPHQPQTEHQDLILLCALCEKDRVKRFLSPEEYQYGWRD